jgi:hypothetical protein
MQQHQHSLSRHAYLYMVCLVARPSNRTCTSASERAASHHVVKGFDGGCGAALSIIHHYVEPRARLLALLLAERLHAG